MALMRNMLYSLPKFPDEPKPSGEQCLRARKVFLPLPPTPSCSQTVSLSHRIGTQFYFLWVGHKYLGKVQNLGLTYFIKKFMRKFHVKINRANIALRPGY